MSCTLLVDVGGTNTRCGLGDERIHDVEVFSNRDYPGLAALLMHYCNRPAANIAAQALIAVAAPVSGHRVRLTNLNWVIDAAGLERDLELSQVRLVNDFAALACSLPYLSAADVVTLKEGQPGNEYQNRAVIGPGTGLGVSGLTYCGSHWHPVCGEGGHVTLAGADEQEEEVIAWLREQFGHASAERALSGPGLINLYNALTDASHVEVPQDVPRLAEQGDAAAVQAIDLFFKFLGTVSADVTLTLGARGGLYLAGGILPAVQKHLKKSEFIARFLNKGRYSRYLADTPVRLIVAENPALLGLHHYPNTSTRPD